ncbi:RNA-guided endonuclease TnpB family protein [Haladaptatus sp. NG-SE-30]
MRRANKLTAHAREKWQNACLCECLAATDAFWNEINYRRITAQKETGNWNSATYTDLYDDYAAVISKATCQQIVQKNAEAWRSYDDSPHDNPSFPRFWGNRREGYDMRTVIRNDLYQINWGAEESTIKIPVGKALNDKYDIPGRGYLVELELKGDPRWKGKPARLEMSYDKDSDCFRVSQSVKVQPDYKQRVQQTDFPHTTTLQMENTEQQPSNSAAIDVGANNTLSIITEDGDIAVFHARPEFNRFNTRYNHISRLQSKLPSGVYSSEQIRTEYAEMYGQRDHHRDAAIKKTAVWLGERGVDDVYVGDLSDVLSTHWSAEVSQKTHNFWSHGQLTEQLENTLEVADISLDEVSEADTSSTCPHCGSEDVNRQGDELICEDCLLFSHSDIVGAALILHEQAGVEVSEWFRPMARPAARDAERARDEDNDNDTGSFDVTYFQWNDHEWTPRTNEVMGTLGSFDQRSVSEPQTSSGQHAGWVAHRGIPRL